MPDTNCRDRGSRLMSDREWKALWYDLKTNAAGNFENAQGFRRLDDFVGSLSALGSAGAAGGIGLAWVKLLGTGTWFGRVLPFIAVTSFSALGWATYCKLGDRSLQYQQTGARYNSLARRAEHALQDKAARTPALWAEITKERDDAERAITYVVSNRIQNYARACVLAKKVKGAEAPTLWSRFFGGLQESNERNKATLMERPLAEWK